MEKVEVKRRPCRLAFHVPPTPDEVTALAEVAKRRSVRSLLSTDQDGDRVLVTVEWVGTDPAPDCLAWRPKERRVAAYGRLGARADV